jgi:hypothetical protein
MKFISYRKFCEIPNFQDIFLVKVNTFTLYSNWLFLNTIKILHLKITKNEQNHKKVHKNKKKLQHLVGTGLYTIFDVFSL